MAHPMFTTELDGEIAAIPQPLPRRWIYLGADSQAMLVNVALGESLVFGEDLAGTVVLVASGSAFVTRGGHRRLLGAGKSCVVNQQECSIASSDGECALIVFTANRPVPRRSAERARIGLRYDRL